MNSARSLDSTFLIINLSIKNQTEAAAHTTGRLTRLLNTGNFHCGYPALGLCRSLCCSQFRRGNGYRWYALCCTSGRFLSPLLDRIRRCCQFLVLPQICARYASVALLPPLLNVTIHIDLNLEEFSHLVLRSSEIIHCKSSYNGKGKEMHSAFRLRKPEAPVFVFVYVTHGHPLYIRAVWLTFEIAIKSETMKFVAIACHCLQTS